ncbi:LysE family translocator [Nocardia flavorosea]|uniref:LysE family translocator n=1 Tax=Nocardia flavorosea TaxID=53429 RepID=UPI001895B38A|nr:LysE family translocator [Nocardia flavorosea]MBF6348828.1 LysE family translocator [Nocardia flavorosea]
MSAVGQYAAFAVVMLFIAVSPGPDMAVIVGRALHGWAAGAAATLGVAVGMFVWVLAAVTGIAALLAASAQAFTIVKITGALYLVHLGVRALLAAQRPGDIPGPEAPVRPGTPLDNAVRGFLSNILNAKAAVLFVALIPQFVPPGGVGLADAIAFPLVAAVVVAAWYLTLTATVAALHRKFADSNVWRQIDTVVGAALIAVGVGVLFGDPPEPATG